MAEMDLSGLPQPLRIMTEQSTPKTRSNWAWLRDMGVTGFMIGVISTIVAAMVTAYFQHSRWYVEQRLARNSADFSAASTTFDTITAELARMQALQEILFFLYREAAAPNLTQPKAAFLAARARETFISYETGRINLRAKFDSYIFNARRHLDWPSSAKIPEILERNGVDRDPLSYGKLTQSASDNEFNCINENTMPQSKDYKTFSPSPFKTFSIDWNSSAHHLIIFAYCFRNLHNLIEPARIWAGNLSQQKDASPPPAPPAPMPAETSDAIVKMLDNQVQRLNGFSAIGMIQVEHSRLGNAPPGFWAFVMPRLP